MNLSSHWHYIEDIARRRLEHNKTENHISRYGSQIEVLGAAGELAARLYLGLPPQLHHRFDGGADLVWRGQKVDVKTTHLTPKIQKRFLQWPYWKPIYTDLVLMAGVDMHDKTAVVLGYVSGKEVANAPINDDRDTPCHEIAVPELRPAWELLVPERRYLSLS
jgi:hypothetical protein